MASLKLLVVFTNILMLSSSCFVLTETRESVIVATAPVITLRKGLPGSLPCKVAKDKQIEALFWNKGPDLLSTENLIYFRHLNNGQWQRSGPGFDTGLYDIGDDFSLNIHNVMVKDQGRYYCEVAIVDDFLYRNHTDVTVTACPLKPFPTVDQCTSLDTREKNMSSCFITTSSTALNITCMVQLYFPSVILWLHHGPESLSPSERRTWENDDGTFSQSVTVEVAPSDVPYECVASDIPCYSHEREVSKQIYIMSDKSATTHTVSTLNSRSMDRVLVPFLAPLVILVCVVCGVLVWRQRYGIRKLITGHGHRHGRGEDMFGVHVNDGSNERQTLIYDETSYVLKLVKRLTSRHVRRIDNVLHSRPVFYSPIDVIIAENNAVILDAEQMLQDWVNEQKEEGFSEDYVRSRLKDAETLAMGKDPNDYNWMCDEDLRYLTSLLPSSFITRLFDQLKWKTDLSDGPFETLRTWRDYSAFDSNEDRRKMLYSALRKLRFTTAVLLESELQHVCDNVSTDHHNELRRLLGVKPDTTRKHGDILLEELKEWRLWDDHYSKGWKRRYKLYRVLTDMGYQGLLSPIKGRYVSTVDLIELATELYMEDIRPFAHALGIEDSTLLKYQQPFKHTHLEKGTFLLMLKLREVTGSPSTTERTFIGQQIMETGYLKVAIKNRLGLRTYPTAASGEDNIRKIVTDLNDAEFNQLIKNVCERMKTGKMDTSSEYTPEEVTKNLFEWATELDQSQSYEYLQIEHRDFIDALVRANFLELAREMKLIGEQYIARRDADILCFN